MSNGFDNHNSIHFLRPKSIFLPMLCRLSIKDIKLNHRRRKDPTFSDDPSSPKVSCMGQVKRNNRRVTAAASPITTHHQYSYSKLKRLFSTKALLPPATSATTATAACRSSKGVVVCVNNLRRLDLKKECHDQKVVDVGELDPPLPVVKRAAPSGVDDGNLWRRRFEGAALKKLQIQHVNLQHSCLKPPTV